MALGSAAVMYIAGVEIAQVLEHVPMVVAFQPDFREALVVKACLRRGVPDMMQRFFNQTLLTAALLTLGFGVSVGDAIAAECVYRCGSDEIQYTPGQSLKLEIVNNTRMQINLERVLDFDPYSMRPGQTVELSTVVGTGADLSVVFWESDYRPVDVRLHRPEVGTLQIEFLPSGSFGDRAVHVVNDGRVLIY